MVNIFHEPSVPSVYISFLPHSVTNACSVTYSQTVYNSPLYIFGAVGFPVKIRVDISRLAIKNSNNAVVFSGRENMKEREGWIFSGATRCRCDCDEQS